jgi:hypothetical protein
VARLRALALAAALLLPAPAASAATTGTFSGPVHIGCFACGGPSSGTGDVAFTGSVNGVPATGVIHLDFRVDDHVATCPLDGQGSGTMSGAVTASFTWTRIGAVLQWTVNGLPSPGTFTITSPAGSPCGQPVDAVVTGSVVA